MSWLASDEKEFEDEYSQNYIRSPSRSPQRTKCLARRNIEVIGQKAKIVMTVQALKKICRRKGLYDTCSINDVLYLNFEGFTQIDECLQTNYTNVKSLFLEGNSIRSIEHLEKLQLLKGLYLQNNNLTRIENLCTLTNISQLDFSNNRISTLEVSSFSNLVNLESLNLKNNLLSDLTEIAKFATLANSKVSCLDLSGNKIADEQIIELLANMDSLKLLYLKGNPFLQSMDFYRKKTVSKLRKLTFLDDRPIFENERRLNDAWLIGGSRAEQNERLAIKQEKIDQRLKTKQERRLKYEQRKNALFARVEREKNNVQLQVVEEEETGDQVSNSNLSGAKSEQFVIEVCDDNKQQEEETTYVIEVVADVQSHEMKDEDEAGEEENNGNEIENENENEDILLPGMVEETEEIFDID